MLHRAGISIGDMIGRNKGMDGTRGNPATRRPLPHCPPISVNMREIVIRRLNNST